MKRIQKLGMALMLCIGVVTATGTASAEPLYDKARGTAPLLEQGGFDKIGRLVDLVRIGTYDHGIASLLCLQKRRYPTHPYDDQSRINTTQLI